LPVCPQRSSRTQKWMQPVLMPRRPRWSATGWPPMSQLVSSRLWCIGSWHFTLIFDAARTHARARSVRSDRLKIKGLSGVPADGILAAVTNQDFGTSRWQLCVTLHQLHEQAEGGVAVFVAVHESARVPWHERAPPLYRQRVCLLWCCGDRGRWRRTAAHDPSATLAVHCGNGFDAGQPYQSTRLSRYNALSPYLGSGL
jgi:hypothetical protein